MDYDLKDTLSHLLRRAHFQAEALFAEILGKYDVTSRQLALLVAVSQNPGASQRTIGHLIELDTNTISDMARRMEQRGLIERQVSQIDSRSYALQLLPAGAGILEEVRRDNAHYQSLLSQRLDADETARLKQLLRKLIDL